MSKVAVKQNILQWALERSNKSVEDLSPKFPKIAEWLAGTSQPTLSQLESLADATHTPFGLMFLDAPPEEHLSIPYFRTLNDKRVARASVDLIETVQEMEQRQAWLRQFLIEDGQEPLSFVKSAKPGESAAEIANQIRAVLRFTDDWASHYATWEDARRALRDAMDRAGIVVQINGVVADNNYRKLNPEEFRGFVLVDEYAPLVFVNGADAHAAQMFTLAHELAHVFFGTSAVFDLKDTMPGSDVSERECNAVAAEFLVPERRIRAFWPSGGSADFRALAKQFKVSPIVIARRALDLKLINRSVFGGFYNEYVQRERAENPARGGDYYVKAATRLGTRFATAVFRALREGKLTYTEAYSLTGLSGKTFNTFMNTAV
jgi:Zn-dependent peptidase ImmA (M78 family)